MSEELNLQSIGDLPVIEGLADGDYLLTVSGGKGKLLPAGNFSGGGGGASMTTYNVTSDDLSTFTLIDASGSPITDFEAVHQAYCAGPIIFKLEVPDQGIMYFHPVFTMKSDVGIQFLVVIGTDVGTVVVGEGSIL